MTEEQKNTQLTITLDRKGKIQLIGAFLVSTILLIGSGYIMGDKMAMDRGHFQEVMDNSTIDTLEQANASFSNDETDVGVNQTEAAMSMVWANLQVTEDPKYEQIWQQVSFSCILEEEKQTCQDMVGQTIDILKGEADQYSTQQRGNSTQPA